MRKFALTVLIMSISLALFGCAAKPSDTNSDTKSNAKPEQTKNELQVAINAQPPTLDVHITTAGITRTVARNIFETLVSLNSQYEPIPELAESVDQSQDAKTYTFHLRKGVKFHNGKEMTAADVVASMNRWKDKYTTTKTILADTSFKAKDDYTVELQLNQPSLQILSIIAGAKQIAAIMPKEIIEAAGSTGVTEYIGTGPFKLKEWKQDQYIHLAKFENYQPLNSAADGLSGKKIAMVDDIYLQIVKDPSTRLSGVQTGQYDVSVGVPYDTYQMLKAISNVKTDQEFNAGEVLVLNKKQGLFSNEKMRKAINAALDMDAIMLGAVSNKQFYRIDSGYMYQEQKNWYSTAGKEIYNQKNPDEAKRLLQEAGYRGEEMVLLTSKDYPEFYNAALGILGQLEKIGIKVKLDVYDWATQQQRMLDPSKYDAFITNFTPVSTPPELLYLNASWPGWTADPKIAEYLKAINTAKSQQEAKQKWDELQQYAWNTLPVIKLGDYYSLYATTDKVKGISYFMGPVLWNTKVLK